MSMTVKSAEISHKKVDLKDANWKAILKIVAERVCLP